MHRLSDLHVSNVTFPNTKCHKPTFRFFVAGLDGEEDWMSALEILLTAAVRFRPLRRTPEDIVVEDNSPYELQVSVVALMCTTKYEYGRLRIDL